MRSDGTLAVAVRGITKRYRNHVAVSELSFSVPEGVIYGFLGPNGAGKTTTLRMLNDIIAPDEGHITILGRFKPGYESFSAIGYLPEERGIYPKMRVRDALRFFGEIRGLRARDAKARALEWLERLELGKWADNRVQDLSKGMQQKVQFASTLLHDPAVLILDEPWSGLDPLNAEVLRTFVLEQKREGKTILFSTHMMSQAEELCDRVCIIAGGRKLVEGTLPQIRKDAADGRRVAIRFADQDSASKAGEHLLADSARFSSVSRHGASFDIELASDTGSQELLADLVAARLPVQHFEIVSPTLHQVFVSKVGEQGVTAASGPRGQTNA